MDEVLLATTARDAIDNYIKNPAAVLLVCAPMGMGKHYLARFVASQLLETELASLDSYPYFTDVLPEKNAISIDTIRLVQQSLIRVVPGSGKTRRVIIIDNAQTLSLEAQNSLLKTLEEPPEATVFILTTPSPELLLTTVVSRTRQLTALPVTQNQSATFYKQKYTNDDIEKAYTISGGRPGLMHALLNDKQHPLLEAISVAKELLRHEVYERLLKVTNLSKDRQSVLLILEALQLLAQASLKAKAKKNEFAGAKRWHYIYKQVELAREALEKNASTKLVLTNLFLQLG